MAFVTYATPFVNNVTTIPADFLNQVRVDLGRAVDGTNAGTYALLAPLVFTGERLELDELQVTLISGPGDTTIDEDVHMVWSFGSYLDVEAGAFVELDGSVDASGSFEFKSGADVEVESGASFDIQAGATWIAAAPLVASSPNDWTPLITMTNVPSGSFNTPLAWAVNASIKARFLGTQTGPAAEWTINAGCDTDGSDYTRDTNNTAASLQLRDDGLLSLRSNAAGSGDFTSWTNTIAISPEDPSGAPADNTLYPGLIPRAWGFLRTASGSAFTTSSLFGCTATVTGNDIEVVLQNAMASSAYVVLATGGDSTTRTVVAGIVDASNFNLLAYDSAGANIDLSATANRYVHFVVFGLQA